MHSNTLFTILPSAAGAKCLQYALDKFMDDLFLTYCFVLLQDVDLNASLQSSLKMAYRLKKISKHMKATVNGKKALT